VMDGSSGDRGVPCFEIGRSGGPFRTAGLPPLGRTMSDDSRGGRSAPPQSTPVIISSR